MPSYVSQVKTKKQFQGNVVILLGGKYFAVRKPDSGLNIPYPYHGAVSSLVLNPTSISPKNVTTSITSYSFKLSDLEGVVSRLMKDKGQAVAGAEVRIWLGYSDEGMDFADYYELPRTKISGFTEVEGGFTYAVRDATDRMNRPIYDTAVRLSGSILAGTTIISSKDDISKFPSSGFFQIGNEIVSYASKDNSTKTFSGCARGEYSTTPADYDDNTMMYKAETITSNPLSILLALLTSGSGSGSYDFLDEGLAIDPALIDVAGIEALRDLAFDGDVFSFALYNIANALKFIEKEILAPCNLRFSFSSDSKLTVVQLDQAQFVEQLDVLDHDTITKPPQKDFKDNTIVNKITIDYDYSEDTGKYQQTAVFEDEDSQATFGKSTSPLTFQFKGVSDPAFITTFGTKLLDRLANPSPEITVHTHMDRQLLNVGNKARLETSLLADEFGSMNFAADLEIVNRAINWQTGDVTFKLQYTSTTGLRLGYIAPSEPVLSAPDQSTVQAAAGRAAYWAAGYKVRLWNKATRAFETDPVNEIASVNTSTDRLAFVNPWATTLTTNHVIKFADYDDANAAQRRYAFVDINGQNFSRTGKQYIIAP